MSFKIILTEAALPAQNLVGHIELRERIRTSQLGTFSLKLTAFTGADRSSHQPTYVTGAFNPSTTRGKTAGSNYHPCRKTSADLVAHANGMCV